MISLSLYLKRIGTAFPSVDRLDPWVVTQVAAKIIEEKISSLGSEYEVSDGVAIHTTAKIDGHAIIKGPAIISSNCFVGAHSYLRGGVFLDENVKLGPGCEVKSSLIFSNTALGHFNFVGDSLVGSNVNLEAGAVVANHYNERIDKTIFVFVGGEARSTGVQKFGAVIGDDTKIGANAVLSPGTILERHSVVKRLQLIEQCAR